MNVSISSRPDTTLPRVAIVGRPNVGKSTLFNRLVGHRHAITDPTPGVTRDPVEFQCKVNDREVILVDTGGVQIDQEGMAAIVSQKSLDSLSGAAVVILLVDVTQLTGEDEDFIALIRPYAERLILAVNKTDNESRESLVWEYHSLGFRRVIPISAEHGRNIDTLCDEIISMLPDPGEETEAEQVDDTSSIRLAILGKPNTGKSTLINQFLGYDRAIVSDVPGTTRDVIEGQFEFKEQRFTVLDTAGIRRKKAVKDPIEYYSVSRAISSVAKSDVVLLMVDSQEGITDQDKKIADQIVKHGRGVILVFNKWDLLDIVANTLNAMTDRARYQFPILDFAPIVPISALEGSGLDQLLDTAIRIREQLVTRIATPLLNQALREWADRHPLPSGKKRYRVKYITQTSADPIKFALFVNNTHGFPGSWVSYLRNNLRQEFKLSSVPIQVDLRGR
jgi:GTPase